MGTYGNGNDRSRKSSKSLEVEHNYDAVFKGYINVNLTHEQKAAYEKWADSSSLWEVLAFQVGDGVNLALRIDPKSSGFLASATQRRSNSPNAGLVVTARGVDPFKAFGRLLYTLAILGKKDRWEDTQPLADPDRW